MKPIMISLGLIWVLLAVFSENPIAFHSNIIIANLWIIASYFKE